MLWGLLECVELPGLTDHMRNPGSLFWESGICITGACSRLREVWDLIVMFMGTLDKPKLKIHGVKSKWILVVDNEDSTDPGIRFYCLYSATGKMQFSLVLTQIPILSKECIFKTISIPWKYPLQMGISSPMCDMEWSSLFFFYCD